MNDNCVEHPAAVAWMQLWDHNQRPMQVEVVSKNDKSTVFRLHGVGPSGVPLIAKRCELASVEAERIVREQILPGLPMPALRFYGVLAEHSSKFGWVFLEDAGDQSVISNEGAVVELASTYMAVIHVASQANEVAPRLPERGPGYFLGRLQGMRSSLQTRLTRPSVDADEAQVIQGFLDVTAQLELNWRTIEDFCSSMPKTLIHGDLASENLRIRLANGKPELLILDWEKAGWGAPAVDLAWVNPAIYWSIVSVHWPDLQLLDIEQLQLYGRIFRTLVHDIASKPTRKIERYLHRLANEMEAAGLARSASSTQSILDSINGS